MIIEKDKLRKLLQPPLLYVHKETSVIDVRSEGFLFGAEKYVEVAFKNFIIIDSVGNQLQIERVHKASNIKLWTSLKYFCPVVEFVPEVEKNMDTIALKDVKTLLIETISISPRKWQAVDSLSEIRKRIQVCSTYKEVMKIFNTKIK